MPAHATDARPMLRVNDVTATTACSIDQFDRVVVEAPLAITVDQQTLPDRYHQCGACRRL
jgi:hypothetical protein